MLTYSSREGCLILLSSVGQAFVAVTKRESCIYFKRKLHLCAHLTVKDLKQPILHAKIEKVAKSNMQKSKKLQKLHAKIEKVAI